MLQEVERERWVNNVLSLFHSLLLVSTRAIMAFGEQGKIKKRNVMFFLLLLLFPIYKVNGTYHDWLVIIGRH